MMIPQSARLAGVLACFALAACAGEQPADPYPTQNVIELSDQFTGDFALVNADGAAVGNDDFPGKVMLVYFGFAHCPDVCPVDVGVMSAALNQIGDNAEDIAPIFISVDPERDTPEALKAYFAFDQRIVALTGSPQAAQAARDGYKVFATRQPLPDSALQYTVNHSRFFFIADRAGQPQLAVVGGVNAEELAAVLRRSIAEF